MGLLKGVFFTGLAFLPILTTVNSLNPDLMNPVPLSCISMNNQKCKVRPYIVNVNSEKPVLFPLKIKISKCSGSFNNINNPYARLCVSNVVKNVNVKKSHLMSGTNETRYIE